MAAMTGKDKLRVFVTLLVFVLLVAGILYAARGDFRMRVAIWAHSIGNFFEGITAGSGEDKSEESKNAEKSNADEVKSTSELSIVSESAALAAARTTARTDRNAEQKASADGANTHSDYSERAKARAARDAAKTDGAAATGTQPRSIDAPDSRIVKRADAPGKSPRGAETASSLKTQDQTSAAKGQSPAAAQKTQDQTSAAKGQAPAASLKTQDQTSAAKGQAPASSQKTQDQTSAAKGQAPASSLKTQDQTSIAKGQAPASSLKTHPQADAKTQERVPASASASASPRWLVLVPRIPIYAHAAEDAPVIAWLARGKIIQANPAAGWLPVRVTIENETSNGYSPASRFEPLENAAQERMLTTGIPKRGEARAADCALRFARALADLDRETLRALSYEQITLHTPAAARQDAAAWRRIVLEHGDLFALSPSTRLAWLPNDEVLTVSLLQSRARAFLRHPLILLENTSASNASGLRLGLAEIGGRWYTSALYVDATHPLLLTQ